MSTLVIPNSFTSNTTISSSGVNANFSAISTFFNSTGINDANITPAGISHVSLANASVQKDTLNANVVDGTSLSGGAGTALSIAAGGVDLTKLASAVSQALCPTGSITAYGGTSAPAGWLLCNGAAVSTTTYAALYAIVGGAFGVSGTFNLPDLRGRFLRGVDGAAGNDPDTLTRTASNTGGNTGNAVGSLQADAYKSHSHKASVAAGNSGLGGATRFGNTAQGGGGIGSTSAENDKSAATAIVDDGTGGSETRPKNVYVNFIIKT